MSTERGAGVEVEAARSRFALNAMRAAAAASVLALWLLWRPYGGIRDDAALYMGKVLADLAPGGVGRDYLFAHDGQFGFSLFPAAARMLTSVVGLSSAAIVLSLGGILLWLLAMSTVAARLARGRTLWAMLVCTALLPAAYSYWFRFAEPIATPRVFAEAAVLAALAVLLGGRRWAALPLLLLAAALHPVMALCGFGVFFLCLCADDRRWLWAGLALGAVGLAAALAGLPLAERLTAAPDARWLDVIGRRTPVIFPSTWPAFDWARTAVQFVTVAMAASLCKGRARLVLGAVLITGVLGLAAALLFGDVLKSLLVMQAQTWRALWLVAALAPASLALCAVRLWPQGPQGRLTLAALALSWVGATTPTLAAPAVALALISQTMMLRERRLDHAHLLAAAIGVCAAVTLAVSLISELRGIYLVLASRPSGAPLSLNPLLTVTGAPLLLAGLAVWSALRPRRSTRGAAAAALLGGLLLAVAAGGLWDDRTPDQRALDRGQGQAGLATRLSSQAGPVYWIDGTTEPWLWAGRPAWFAYTQGAGVVFSRPLALTWNQRHRQLVAAGAEADLGKLTRPLSPLRLTDARARRICGWPDGPAWIVAPSESARLREAGRVAGVWTPPAPSYGYRRQDGAVTWTATRSYVLVSCASVIAGPERPRLTRPVTPPSR